MVICFKNFVFNCRFLAILVTKVHFGLKYRKDFFVSANCLSVNV
jgi:hypothetical protein